MGQANKGKTLVTADGLFGKGFGKGSVGTMAHPEHCGHRQHKGWHWGTAGTLHPGHPAVSSSPTTPPPWHMGPEQVLGAFQELAPEPRQVDSVSQGRDGAWETKSGSGWQREEGAAATNPGGSPPDTDQP